jgi:hypothetical protein
MTGPLQERHGYAKSEAMPTDAPQRPANPDPAESSPTRHGPLTQEAECALAEAAARRAQAAAAAEAAAEIGGRGGLDPARYGDWEINGLAADF